MQPDLTVGRTYSTPLCFQDSTDKELFDPLPDIKVKVQSSFMVSLGVAERAEFHAKAPAETFPRDLSRDYCSTMDRRKKGLLTLNGPFSSCKEPLRTTGVFGHHGGRLVVPNTGELYRKVAGLSCKTITIIFHQFSCFSFFYFLLSVRLESIVFLCCSSLRQTAEWFSRRWAGLLRNRSLSVISNHFSFLLKQKMITVLTKAYSGTTISMYHEKEKMLVWHSRCNSKSITNHRLNQKL